MKQERATPKLAMTPQKRIHIYIRRAGTVDGAARGERPPTVWVPLPGNAQPEGEGGGEKTGGWGVCRWNSVGARLGLWGLQRGSCVEQVLREGIRWENPPHDSSGVLSVEDDA